MKEVWVSIGLALLLTPSIGQCLFGLGDVVIDPTNLAQNTLTAAQTLKSNTNEVLQLNQAIQGYIQDAKAFVAIPMSYVDQVSSLYAEYNNALNQARGMAYTVQNASAQFQALYDVGFQGNAGFMQRAQAMIGQIRAASHAATQATALFTRLCAQQASVTTLIAASQIAPGSLGAQQATNQLLGVLADQQGSLQGMQATIGRVQVGYIMRQAVAEEQAQTNAQQFLMLPEQMPWRDRPSKGFTLPD